MSSSEEDDVVVEFEDEEEKEVESDEGDREGVDSDEDGEEEIDRVEVESECDQSQEQDGDQVSKKKKKKKITPGVVYLSRIPPFMRPCKVRHLLSQCGNIGRIYLQPEDPLIYKRRKRFKKNKRRNYTEGWVEFTDKRVAKATAMALNNTQIGGKKRYYYHDDIWNMKYLSKFRWSHLTEKIAYEQAVEDQKLRMELSQLKRETDKYLENYELSKQVTAIIDRKRKKGKDLLEYTRRRIKQNKVAPNIPLPTTTDHTSSATPTTSSGISLDLLRMILPDRSQKHSQK